MKDESSFDTVCCEIIYSGIVKKTAKLPILTRDKRENLHVLIQDFYSFITAKSLDVLMNYS